MRLGSLFAGIGGFDLAAERVGMTVEWSSEIDKHASRVLDHHWPHVKNLGDIHGITNAPRVDVLTGGFPCQDYSMAGKGAGLAGDRGALWWQYHRLIAEQRPTWVVGENVAGLTAATHRDSFATIAGSLVDLGYGVVWRILDARAFGVPQQRRRVFIVGHSGGHPRPEILALGRGSENSTSGDSYTKRLGASISAGRAWFASWNTAPTVVAQLGGVNGHSWKLHIGAFNERAVRRLTPLECERLQGFPDGWTDIPGNSDTQRYRQLGNAVAVPVVEWILRNIKEAT